jgi:hypothetical protein
MAESLRPAGFAGRSDFDNDALGTGATLCRVGADAGGPLGEFPRDCPQGEKELGERVCGPHPEHITPRWGVVKRAL